MNALFDLMLGRLPGVTVLLLVLLIARHWVLRFLNARVAYALWLLLPAYLVFPFEWLASQNDAIEGMLTFQFNSLNTEYDAVRSELSNNHLNWLAGVWGGGVLVRCW